MPSDSASKNRRHRRPALAPTAKVQPQVAEVRQGEVRAPEPAEYYDPAALASAGSASGSSPRPVPAEGILAVKAPAEGVPADWAPAWAVPADSSPGSAAVAIPAA